VWYDIAEIRDDKWVQGARRKQGLHDLWPLCGLCTHQETSQYGVLTLDSLKLPWQSTFVHR
jgi:hypothetical protein